MKKTLFKVSLAAIVFGSLTFTSCTKEGEGLNPWSQEAAVEDNNDGFSESEDLISISDEVLADNLNSGRVSAEGKKYYDATVTITPMEGDMPGEVVIDFGADGKRGKYGRLHKGKIMITYTSRSAYTGTRTITFENYSVNGNKVEGTKTITFTNSPSEGMYSATVASALVITKNDGRIVEWTSSRTRIYNTKNTADWNDDEVSLSGTASGTNRRGLKYVANITTSLTIKASCLSASGWLPSSGVLEVMPENGSKRTVNYGSGSCDRVINVAVGDKNFDMTIN